MNHDDALSPIVHNRKREASVSTAGTLYHVWRAIQEWIALDDDEELFLEGAEDIDHLHRNVATLIQLRNTVGALSLNSQKVLEAIGHYWDHYRRNPSRHVRYRYSTIAGIAREQGRPYGSDRPGLELWAEVRDNEDPAHWEPIVTSISRVLANDERLPEDLRSFLVSATPAVIREKLFLPVEFDTWSDNLDQVRLEVRRAVIRHGQDLDMMPAAATRAIPALVQRVIEAIVDPRNRRLQRIDFDDVFSHATTFPVAPNHIVAGVTAEGARLVVGIDEILRTLPQLPERYYRRAGLIDRLSASLDRCDIAFIVASSGKGKTLLALAYAPEYGARWMVVNLRDYDAAGVGRVLRATRTQIQQMDYVPSLLIEDMNPVGDTRDVVRSLVDLVQICRDATQKVIVTSYTAPDRLFREALGISSEDDIAVPDFTEDDIQQLLAGRGAPASDLVLLARAVYFSTSGHPTLVDVHSEALRSKGFPRPSAASVLQTPGEVLEERDRVRRFIGSLPQDDQSLLYRASLSVRPMLREQLLRAASASIAPEGPIRQAGSVLDRLIGPWLELDPTDRRLRLSPLLRDAGVASTDPDWVVGARRALARALLSVSPVDVRDATDALLHALQADDRVSVATILMGFTRETDRGRFAMLATIAPWLSAVGIDVPPIPALQGPFLSSLLRNIQYRLAAATEDSTLAARIVEHFERDIRDDPMATGLRLLFYGITISNPAESGAAIMQRAMSFLTAAQLAEAAEDGSYREVLKDLRDADDDEDVVSHVGSVVFAAVKNRHDIDAVVTELGKRDRDFARRFLSWLDRTTIAWRGVAATLIVSELDESTPDLTALADSIKQLSTFARSVSLDRLSIDVIASAAALTAEHQKDTLAADRIIDDAELNYGRTPRFERARAVVRHAGGDWADALRLFKSSFGSLEREADDPELPMDMRLAANAAGNLGLFSEATALLERASSLLISTRQPTIPAGLLMDAAYAAWRGGDDPAALRLAVAAVNMLDVISLPIEDPRVQNAVRRALYVLLMMSERIGTTVGPEDSVLAVGFASNPEPFPDEVAVVPKGLLFATAALLEHRVNGGTTVVDANLDVMLSAGGPAEGMAIYLRLNALARRGELDELMSTISDLNRIAAFLREREGNPGPEEWTMGRAYLTLALLSYSTKGKLTNAALMRLIADAERFGLSALSRWIVRGVDFLADPREAINVLNKGGESDEERLMASLIVSSMPNVAAPGLFLAQQALVALLGVAEGSIPVLGIILEASRAIWHRALGRSELFPIGSAEAQQELHIALDAPGTTRQQLLAIFYAARDATQSPLHGPVETFLSAS